MSFTFDGTTTQGKSTGVIRGQWAGSYEYLTMNFPAYATKGTIVFEPGKVYVKGTPFFLESQLTPSSHTGYLTVKRWSDRWISVSPGDRAYKSLHAMNVGASMFAHLTAEKNVTLVGQKTIHGVACAVVSGTEASGAVTTDYVSLKAPHYFLRESTVSKNAKSASAAASSTTTVGHYGAKYHGPVVSHATPVSLTPLK